MQKFIKSSLDYIEQNLKSDITAEELAQMAGYSVWYYYRLFSDIMGSSVANYILKRRLDHALAEISSGRKAVDVVLEYGFETYAGFYKAFVRMYGCSPKKYLSVYKNHISTKLEVLIMYNEKELQKILENWDIPQDSKIEDVSEYDWKRWKIGEYYLTTNDREKIIRNIKIAKALNKEGLSSMFLPIPTKSGDEYLDGENIFILTQKTGSPLNDNAITDENRNKYAHKYGQSMAKLHKAYKAVEDDIKPDEVNLYKQVTEWAIPEVKKYNQKYNMQISEDFFNDYIQTFGKLYDKLPKHFIHRNPHGGNILFENDEITGFIGFEYYNECNLRIFDILYCAGGTCVNNYDEDGKWTANIYKGYDSVTPLTVEEKRAIFYVSCSIGMIFIAYCNEEEEVAKNNREGLVKLINSKQKFDNIF